MQMNAQGVEDPGMATGSRAPKGGARRSLAPREHGAYGQLAAPIVAALAMGQPGTDALLLAAGAAAAFAAQEPLRLVLGHRGKRAQREDGQRAARVGAVLGAIALGCGVAAVSLGTLQTRRAVMLPIVLASVAAGFVLAKQEKSLAGELVAASALASVGVPIAIASGVAPAVALLAWAGWAVGFAASTFAVRSVIHHAREPQPAWRRLLAPGLLAAGSAAAVAAGLAPSWALAAASPLLLASLGLSLWPPSPRHLKRTGWALVASTVATTLILSHCVGF